MEEQRPRPKKLMDQVGKAIRLKHCFIRTEQACIDCIKLQVLFHNVRHPAEMGAVGVEAFLPHLAVTENKSPPPKIRPSVPCLYREVLHQELAPAFASSRNFSATRT